MKEEGKERKLYPLWTVFLGAIPVTILLFLTIFRSLLAGPEMALFEGINLCVLAHFLWHRNAYEAKYGEKKVAQAKVVITIYTIAQILMTVYMFNQFFVTIYTGFQSFLIVFLFVAMQFIWKEERK